MTNHLASGNHANSLLQTVRTPSVCVMSTAQILNAKSLNRYL